MANHGAELDRTFHALSDPTRRTVVELLTDGGVASVTELAAPFPIGLPTFLKHLKVLEDSGLVASAKSGRIRTCRIRTEHLDEAEVWLSRRRRVVDGQIDSFATHVESIHRNEGGRT
jgi:DNA-binding transcriptional ArsR family regulator